MFRVWGNVAGATEIHFGIGAFGTLVCRNRGRELFLPELANERWA